MHFVAPNCFVRDDHILHFEFLAKVKTKKKESSVVFEAFEKVLRNSGRRFASNAALLDARGGSARDQKQLPP